ncbi:BREX-3 system P-loop-containing protein BrxF [uncultured Methanobrevibacter sp.]|uniref:BREX-3 system P-loop-containing protein BrxF n=1 Tax=uncultured Methanobrevibacter sp. TaxID=253161 RepID=UPI0025F6295E|nr:BREX-3 system P-loop-containing protein BrxF [uncultured Methanobrevibacter sp.]
MNLKEAIEDLQTGTKHYKLIVLNKESKDCINECKSLDFDGVVKVDINRVLNEKLLDGKTKEEKEHETWDLIKNYLDSLNFNILFLHNVEYMFSKELGNLDVISNFKYYSRNGHIIVLFVNGKLIDNHLIYSEEGYPDYRSMDVSEVNLVGWE